MSSNVFLIQKISNFSFDKKIIEKIRKTDNKIGDILYLYQLYNDNKLLLISLKIYEDYLSRLIPILKIVPKIDFGDKNFLSEEEKYVLILLLLILLTVDKIHFKSEEEKIKVYIKVSQKNESIEKTLDELSSNQIRKIINKIQGFILECEYLLKVGNIELKEELEKKVNFIENHMYKFFEDKVDFAITFEI